jgi:hypothetical protein
MKTQVTFKASIRLGIRKTLNLSVIPDIAFNAEVITTNADTGMIEDVQIRRRTHVDFFLKNIEHNDRFIPVNNQRYDVGQVINLECKYTGLIPDWLKDSSDPFHLEITIEGTVLNEESKPEPVEDKVNHPKHYTSHPSGIECIEIVEHMPFNVGNAIKYLWRAGLKSEDTVEDLKKAEWYVKRQIEMAKKTKKVVKFEALNLAGASPIPFAHLESTIAPGEAWAIFYLINKKIIIMTRKFIPMEISHAITVYAGGGKTDFVVDELNDWLSSLKHPYKIVKLP